MNPVHHHATSYNEEKVGRAAFQAFLSISEKWKLTAEQQRVLLGDIPKSTYHLWKSQVLKAQNIKLAKDTLERISYILGIYKSLNILLSNPQAVNDWIHKPNDATLFGGKAALDKMLAGNVIDLADVRRFLDAERGD